MKGLMVTYPPDGGDSKRVELDGPPKLETLQNAVEGYIEVVPFFTSIEVDGKVRSCVAFCNEEGKLHGLPVNTRATTLWEKSLKRGGSSLFVDGRAQDYLVGPIVVISGGKELLEAL